ncbi:MAG: type II toxin-antitoxin system YafO family toxin [Pontibacterium sp.]
MTVTVKVAQQLLAQEGMAGLIAGFLKYLKAGKEGAPSYFGRDVAYHKPRAAVLSDLHHLHLKPTAAEEALEAPYRPWDDRAAQYYRTSNKFMVYTRGEQDCDCYVVLAIVFPRAHELAEDGNHMAGLIAMAESAKK